jgi:hypothetical protein
LSLTAPISVGLLIIPVLNQWYWGDACIFRLFAMPIAVVVLIFSRWLTRFARARRLISYALLIEGLTFIAIIAALFLLKGPPRLRFPSSAMEGQRIGACERYRSHALSPFDKTPFWGLPLYLRSASNVYDFGVIAEAPAGNSDGKVHFVP